jgi:hypothetical protein
VTAGREDETAGALGQIRTSHGDREQAVDVLKAAFVDGRLTKDEFDLRVGRVFASRTYADLDALTADIPDEVTSAQPSAERVRESGRVLSFKTAARVGTVGAFPSMVSALVVTQSSRVPAVAGGLLVGLTGLFVAGLLTALLMLVSWVVRRSQRRAAQGPPPGPAGAASRRRARARQLPPAGRDPRQTAEAIRSRLPRIRVSPAQGRGHVPAVKSC